jgi:hypothetical protein
MDKTQIIIIDREINNINKISSVLEKFSDIEVTQSIT